MNFTCAVCSADSGTSLVCRTCIPKLSTGQRAKFMTAWHRVIVERANCACEDCGHSAEFESGELCGDHVLTKGSRPDLVFDVTNGRCVCLPCHNKRHNTGLPKRGVPEKRQKVKKALVCPKCRIRLALPDLGGKCPECA